jgi:hypothetical protein
MDEQWKAVPGYEPYYEASSLGAVRLAKTGRLLKPWIENGYPKVGLWLNGRCKKRFVHTVVLETFVGPCPDGMQCRHFPDPARANVALDNPSWGTPTDNARDRVVHGTMPRGENHWHSTKPHRTPRGDSHYARTRPERLARGERVGGAKLTECGVDTVLWMLNCGVKQAPIAWMCRVDQTLVSSIKLGKVWKTRTLEWLAKQPKREAAQ